MPSTYTLPQSDITFLVNRDSNSQYVNLADRKAFQKNLVPITPYRRMGACGLPLDSTVDVIKGHHGHGVAGIMHCGLNCCPVCAPKIAAKRQQELEIYLNCAARDHHLLFTTFTMQHGKRSKLKDMLEAQSKAFSSIFSARYGKNLSDQYGKISYVYIREITHSDKNGWHPHIHAVIALSKEKFDLSDVPKFESLLISKWRNKLRKLGYESSLAHAVDMQVIKGSTGKYITKYLSKICGLSFEMSHRHKKECAQGHRSQWLIAKDAVDGCEKSKSLWWQYCSAIKRKNMIVFSRSFKKLFGNFVEEKSDEQLANESEEILEKIAEIPSTIYKIYRYDRNFIYCLLANAHDYNSLKTALSISFPIVSKSIKPHVNCRKDVIRV